jgi:2-phosphosulfolactate phosphatase
MRPAYEDWIGAGSIAALLADAVELGPEAAAAAAGSQHRRPLVEVMSGNELVERGFADDVAMAEDYGAGDEVPVLVDGRFVSS